MTLCPKIWAEAHGNKTKCGLKSHDSRKRDTSFRTGSLDQLRRWTLPVGCLKLQRQETKTFVIQWCKQRQRRWCWKWWTCTLTWTLYAEADPGGQPFCPSVTYPSKNVSDLHTSAIRTLHMSRKTLFSNQKANSRFHLDLNKVSLWCDIEVWLWFSLVSLQIRAGHFQMKNPLDKMLAKEDFFSLRASYLYWHLNKGERFSLKCLFT